MGVWEAAAGTADFVRRPQVVLAEFWSAGSLGPAALARVHRTGRVGVALLTGRGRPGLFAPLSRRISLTPSGSLAVPVSAPCPTGRSPTRMRLLQNPRSPWTM